MVYHKKNSGVITRKRSTGHKTEESAMDFVCISSDMVNSLVSINFMKEETMCCQVLQRQRMVQKSRKVITTQPKIEDKRNET